MKLIPYGISDYTTLRTEGYYYIDKTSYIPKLEFSGSFLLLTRPQRMGKSLFTSMLMDYYDINKKDRFQQLFGDLYIGQNPTPLANKYFVLKFDFSKVGEGLENLAHNFTTYCRTCLKEYLKYYSQYYTQSDAEEILSSDSISQNVNQLIFTSKRKGYQLYLFLDEYDNFTNQVLAARGVNAHREITHGEGFYRGFFKVFKDSFRRIFMTGVAPVTYDDLSSGFNIALVITLDPWFNQSVGVTETELRQLIEYYREAGEVSMGTDEIIQDMKPWFDGFCFSEDCYGTDAPIYNTSMVWRYVYSLMKTGKPPKEMVDRSARVDNQKLDYLILSPELDYRDLRVEIVNEICRNGYTTGSVIEQFPAERCGWIRNFKSMLYYYGSLTFGCDPESGSPRLVIPNKTMADLYLGYMLHVIEQYYPHLEKKRTELDNKIRNAAEHGEWQPMVEQMGEMYQEYSSIHNSRDAEADAQGFLRGLLCLNDYYDVWPELELNNGNCDLLLIPRNNPQCLTRYSYVIELKRVKADVKPTEAVIQKEAAEAAAQLNQYIADTHLRETGLLRNSTITPLYLVFHNRQLIRYGLADE